MSIKKQYIPAPLKSAVKNGYVTDASEILDENKGKRQDVINQELYALITSLPVSDGTDIDSGSAYIDSTDRCVKVKA